MGPRMLVSTPVRTSPFGLGGIRRLWVLIDHFSSTLVAVRDEAALDIAREDERRRLSFVRLALDPDATEEQVLTDGAAYGVEPIGSSEFLARQTLNGE